MCTQSQGKFLKNEKKKKFNEEILLHILYTIIMILFFFFKIYKGMQGFPLQAGEMRGIPLNLTLMPEHLHRLGYDTHLVGKWHLGFYTEDHTPTKRGFDTFFGYYNGLISYFSKSIVQPLDDGRVRIIKIILIHSHY